MTYEERSNLAFRFFKKITASNHPEEDLKKEKLVSDFLADLTDKERAELQSAYKEAAEDKTYEDYIYHFVLGLGSDVRTEYMGFKNQADDCLELIQSKKRDLVQRKLNIANANDPQYRKILELISRTDGMEKETRKRSAQDSLVRLAILSSLNPFISLFSDKRFFVRMKLSVLFQDMDVRLNINFGHLPVSLANEMMRLKSADSRLYLSRFKQIIEDCGIIERIKASVGGNPLMSDRLHIVEESLKYFQGGDYQMFAHIIVPQIEGFFRLYMEAVHITKEKISIGEIVSEIDKKQRFSEYFYFKYDFTALRNPVAHGDAFSPSEEEAYDILMDLHWIVSKVDSDDRDYKKWMKWLREFSACPDERMKIYKTLDYFGKALEANENLGNLKYALSHAYARWIKKYGLQEAENDFHALLKNEKLYAAIWNENTPLVVNETMRIDGKERRTERTNEEPSRFRKFAELMNQHRLCSETWYRGYEDYLARRNKLFEDWLETAKKNNGNP